MPVPAGFKYKEVSGDWPYRITDRYDYEWKTKPKWELEARTYSIMANGKAVASLANNSVTLLPGYAWDGSTGVPDTKECMRASALHDVWCQAMRATAYLNDYENWRRAAKEYYDLCVKDGMSKVHAGVRWVGLVTYGAYKFFVPQPVQKVVTLTVKTIAKGIKKVWRWVKKWF